MLKEMICTKSTVKDVAKLARVSTATVSRVVNGSCSVSRVTKERVLSAVSWLQYCPNGHAAALGRANGGIPRRRGAHIDVRGRFKE